MTNAAFKNKIAPGDHYFDPKIKAIRGSPGNEHLVSAGDLSAACGDKEPEVEHRQVAALRDGYATSSAPRRPGHEGSARGLRRIH